MIHPSAPQPSETDAARVSQPSPIVSGLTASVWEHLYAHASLSRQLLLLTITAAAALFFSIDLYTNSIEVKRTAVAVLGALALLAVPVELICGPSLCRQRWSGLRRIPAVFPWALLAIYASSRVLEHQVFDARASLHLWWMAWMLGVLWMLSAVDRRFRIRWLGLHALLGIVVGGYALLQTLEVDDDLFRLAGLTPVVWPDFDWGSSFRRVVGTLGNPDFLAGYLIGTLPLLLPLWSITEKATYRGVLRGLIVLSGILQLLGIVLSLSRGVWVGAFFAGLAALVLLWFLSRSRPRETESEGRPTKGRRLRRAAIALVCIALASIVLWAAHRGLGQRFSAWGDHSIRGRLHIYEGSLALISDNSWIGTGMGTFGSHFPEARPAGLTRYEPFDNNYVGHAHSELLEVASDLGVVGLGLWIWTLVAVGITAVRVAKMGDREASLVASACLVAGIAIVAHNVVTVTLRHPPSLFLIWQLVGTVLGLDLVHSRLVEEPVQDTAKVSPRQKELLTALVLIAVAVLGFWRPGVRHVAAEKLLHEGHRLNQTLPKGRPLSAPETGRARAAMRLLARADTLEPDRRDLWYWRAHTAWLLRDYTTSIRCYKHVLVIAGNFVRTRHAIATVYLAMSDPLYSAGLHQTALRRIQDSIAWSKLAIEDDPGVPSYLDYYARALFVSGAFEEARQMFEQARELYEDPRKRDRIDELLQDIEEAEAMRSKAEEK